MAKVKKGRYRKYSKEFRDMAVERVMKCDNVVKLAEELGIHERLLYRWREEHISRKADSPRVAGRREMRLRNEINQLKRLLADKTLESDFFRGALQKVEGRRQQSGISGETASTTKSGK